MDKYRAVYFNNFSIASLLAAANAYASYDERISMVESAAERGHTKILIVISCIIRNDLTDSKVKSSSSCGPPDRKRCAFSPKQVSRLEHEFATHRYLTVDQRARLAAELQLSEQQVRIIVV